jgi:hypothetical protein
MMLVNEAPRQMKDNERIVLLFTVDGDLAAVGKPSLELSRHFRFSCDGDSRLSFTTPYKAWKHRINSSQHAITELVVVPKALPQPDLHDFSHLDFGAVKKLNRC